MSTVPHSPEKVALLRELRAAGESYTTIQKALGLPTRSAAAGMVARHCNDIPRPKRAVAEPVPTPSVQPARVPSAKRVATKPVAVPPPPAPPVLILVSTRPKMPVPPGVDPVHFVEAKGCRWPLWSPSAAFAEKKVCNAACREGQSFCPEHARLAYVPRQARRVA